MDQGELCGEIRYYVFSIIHLKFMFDEFVEGHEKTRTEMYKRTMLLGHEEVRELQH